MTHAYHDELPGFDPRQILKDGCEECEARSKNLRVAINMLDEENFKRAWMRAKAWESYQDVGRVSDAERPLLEILYAFRNQVLRVCHVGGVSSDIFLPIEDPE